MEPGWKPIQPHDLPHVLQRPPGGGEPCLVIDTRDAESYFEAHIDGSINVPVPTFTPRSGSEFGHMYAMLFLQCIFVTHRAGTA
jgi:rhodanese-related sulfurtransferase